MNGKRSVLYLIAAVSMVIDHVGASLFPQFFILRIIGRLAFPIFAWGIAQGIKHTGDIKKYVTRIFIGAVIAQPFYWYALSHSFNIMFELGFFVLILYFLQEEKYVPAGILSVFVWIANIDYGIYGLIVTLAFYFMEYDKKRSILCIVVADVIAGFYSAHFAQAFSVLALPLIFYIPECRFKMPRYFFYGFYPFHLAVIAAIKAFM